MATTPRRPERPNLIEQLLTNPLEPGYEAERDRRARRGPETTAMVAARHIGVLVTTVLIGLLLAMGYQTLRAPEASSSPRSDLAQRLQDRQELQQEQSAALARELRAVEDQQNQVLTTEGREQLADQYRATAVAAAGTELRGQGVRITLADPQSDDPTKRVVSADLQRVVNTLWAAGAEGISVNAHRLSANAGIRFAGRALVVDFRALQPPYVVEAVGPPELEQRFADTGGAAHLDALRRDVGIRSTVERADLTLDPDPTLTIHHARAVTQENR